MGSHLHGLQCGSREGSFAGATREIWGVNLVGLLFGGSRVVLAGMADHAELPKTPPTDNVRSCSAPDPGARRELPR